MANGNMQATGAVSIDLDKWWLIGLLGVISIAAGVLAIAYPDITLLVLGLVFGINLLIIGTVWVLLATTEELSTGGRVLRMIVGFLGVLAGLFCLVHPGQSVLALLLVVAFWFVMVGVADIARAIDEPEGRVISAILGVLSIAAGIIIVSDPDIGLETLALLAGIYFTIRGIIEIAAAFYMRSLRGAAAG
jgi:uncharacterized membrane protein HdeD (DUF308 family)